MWMVHLNENFPGPPPPEKKKKYKKKKDILREDVLFSFYVSNLGCIWRNIRVLMAIKFEQQASVYSR